MHYKFTNLVQKCVRYSQVFVIAEFFITEATPIHFIRKPNKVGKFVLYSRVFVITEFVIAEFDCNRISISPLSKSVFQLKSAFSSYWHRKLVLFLLFLQAKVANLCAVQKFTNQLVFPFLLKTKVHYIVSLLYYIPTKFNLKWAFSKYTLTSNWENV